MKEFAVWYCENYGVENHLALSTTDVLFGNIEFKLRLNHFLLLLKYHIYASKWNNTHPSFQICKLYFIQVIKLEKYIGTKQKRNQAFQEKWGTFVEILNN